MARTIRSVVVVVAAAMAWAAAASAESMYRYEVILAGASAPLTVQVKPGETQFAKDGNAPGHRCVGIRLESVDGKLVTTGMYDGPLTRQVAAIKVSEKEPPLEVPVNTGLSVVQQGALAVGDELALSTPKSGVVATIRLVAIE